VHNVVLQVRLGGAKGDRLLFDWAEVSL